MSLKLPSNAAMEATSSATVTMNLHATPPNTYSNTSHFFQFRASSRSRTVPNPKPPSRGRESFRLFKQKLKPFLEKDAFPESLPLHTKNPSSIYKDIQRFSRQNKLKEALTILDYLEKRGIPLNPTTFSSLIAACVRTKSLSEGKQIHTHIRINGLESNEFLRTKLVHMYTSCGSLDDALKVFDECSCESVYPWNALLRGSVILGRRQYRNVISTFSEMRASGVELNVYTFSNVIKSFAGASAFFQGLKTHALLVKNGLLDSLILRTSLIDMYFKCGKIKLAHQVFAEICNRDIVVWGAMIAGFAHNRLNREALDYVRWMTEEGTRPNSVIVTTILPVIGEVQGRKLGQEIHAYVVKTKSYSKLIPVQSALIDMYCKCGDIDSGRQAFYSSNERNAICWTALMSGYALNGRLEQALRSIIWMQQEGFRPDAVTIATALPICTELRAVKPGKEIHAYAMKNWYLPNVSIVSSLMVMYSKCGLLEYCTRLFGGMEQKNVILWTAMIDSFIENRCPNEALSVIRSMQLSRHRPDSVAMSRMLTVCSGLKLSKLGKEIHGQLLKRDLVSVHFVSAELVKMYGSCGMVKSAKSAFEGVPVKGSMTWTAIIEAYEKSELFKEAIDLFDEMRSKGSTPNQHTFKLILSICNKAGMVEGACRIFNLMCCRYKLKATQEDLSIIVQLLTRYGRMEEAQRFIRMSSYV